MNHLYRIVWNAHGACWQAVSEIAKGRGKRRENICGAEPASGSLAANHAGEPCLRALVLGMAIGWLGLNTAALAGPEGGTVSAGSASISQSGNTTTINQSTDRAAINWNRFSVGADEAVRFNQPSSSSATLNRVTGTESSQIMGSLSANGHVFILNPNGVLFGTGAQVNVGGIVTSTLNMSNEDFMSGKINLKGESTAAVTNDGDITTEEGGTVVLIAAEVNNNGTISASQGNVVLAGASSLTQTSVAPSPNTPAVTGPTVTPPTPSAAPAHAVAAAPVSTPSGSAPSVQAPATVATAEPATSPSSDTQTAGGSVAASGTDPVAPNLVATASAAHASEPISASSAPVRTDSPVAIAPPPAPTAVGEAKAADQFTVRLQDGSLVGYTIDRGAVSALVSNGGLIKAPGGQVVLTAQGRDSLAQATVNQSGVIEAQTMGDLQGNISLSSSHGMVNTGTLNASGGAQGQGGQINIATKNLIDAGQYDVSGGAQGGRIGIQASHHIEQTAAATLNANASNGQAGAITIAAGHDAFLSSSLSANGNGALGQGGLIHLTAPDLQLAAAIVSATGSQQGGQVAIGGGWQGKDASIANANTTKVIASQIDVSATDAGQASAGNAGTAVLWSEQSTTFTGAIQATGGAIAGDGGMVEISSHGNLQMGGTVNASASHGANGTLLLDPKNIEIVAGGITNYSLLTLADPEPHAGEYLGYMYAVELVSNGVALNRVAIASSGDDTNGTDTGAVRVYDSQSGALISTLTGSQANDQVGIYGFTVLANGNFLVNSAQWANGDATKAGAMTWGNGTTGVSGVVSSSNSLVGSSANDQVGSYGVTLLTNGNYLVKSGAWNNGSALSAGALTWGNAETGVRGQVTETNSLVGSSTEDWVGSSVTALSNGNYLVRSFQWDSPFGADAGAVTWGDGTTGIAGRVSASNSLVGSRAGDLIGSTGVVELSNGNYVVSSPNWSSPSVRYVGAATWGNGTTGVTGAVSSGNSLVGSSYADRVGWGGATALSNGNYVVNSSLWTNASGGFVGAATWGNGETGVDGAVSAANSLVGSVAGDEVGASGITALSNGNYVVSSSRWDSVSAADVGAATWGNGATGVIGAVSEANSLVGSAPGDAVGSGRVTALSNGNYVVRSNVWANGAELYAGAVTWGDGKTGVVGRVSEANSLVGSTTGDRVGTVMALSNGNYVVRSFDWDSATATDAGAVTWGNGTTGVSGAITPLNSLVGSKNNDRVGAGAITELSNGNYVAVSSYWNSDAATEVGAATWGSGTEGVKGVLSETNSLVGSRTGDKVGIGSGTVTALSNGNYVVTSRLWNSATAAGAGAVTWGNGTTGVSGIISAGNSLVGSSTNDHLENVRPLSNGNYVVVSSLWDNGSAIDAGAVTWADGETGIRGYVSEGNSLVGSTAYDRVGIGGISALSQGNYLVSSSIWDNGSATNAGAVTWGSGTTGVSGRVSALNSLVGSTSGDQVGDFSPVVLSDGRVLVVSPGWSNGGLANAGRAEIIGGPAEGLSTPPSFATNPSASSKFAVDAITAMLNAGTNVVLQANNDITLSTQLTANNPGGNGGALTLQAGRSVYLNGSITTDNGNLTVIANDRLASGVVDAERDAGEATLSMAPGTQVDAGTGAVTLELRDGAGLANHASGDVTLDNISAGSIKAINSGSAVDAGVVLNGTLAASDTAGTAIELAGQQFTNNAGATALSVGTGSRWLVWSGDPDDDTPAGLTPAFTQYSATYGSSAVAGEGNGLLYEVAADVVSPPPPPAPAPAPSPSPSPSPAPAAELAPSPAPAPAATRVPAPPPATAVASAPEAAPVVALVPVPAPPPDVWPGLLEEKEKAALSEGNPVATDGEGMRQPEKKDELVSIGSGS